MDRALAFARRVTEPTYEAQRLGTDLIIGAAFASLALFRLGRSLWQR